MIIELGHFALVVAFSLALVQSVLPILGTLTENYKLMKTGNTSSFSIFFFISASFLALTWAYATSDFSVVNVWKNSHSTMPILFKVTALWGNHEGSMLLWVFILSLFSVSVTMFGSNLPIKLKANIQGIQAVILSIFLLFIIFTSNPFARQNPLPEGKDLNPILQDLALAIHPPILYLGYVGFSITFSFAIAALIDGKIDSAWARWVRPWVLVSWMFLTAGISVGSYWAYYELGWGGWWFWDPVENSSLLPWLSGTALLHSALVMEKREALKIWTILLAILTFSLSLLGTFLVRSGILMSIHTFVTNPTRGLFILIILCIFVGGSFLLFGFRCRRLQTGGFFAPISREGTLIVNNVLLITATATVLIGTLYPLVYQSFTGMNISVGGPFFNRTLGPLMIPLLIVIPFGPLLAWKKGDARGALQRLYVALGASFLSFTFALALIDSGPWLAPFGIGLSIWLIIGSFASLIHRSGIGKLSVKRSVHIILNFPITLWATPLAHFGIGVTLLGVVCATAFEQERSTLLQPGDSIKLAGYEITYSDYLYRNGPNFGEEVIKMNITKDNQFFAFAEPAKRFYLTQKMPTRETSIHTIGFSQLYIAIGDINEDQSVSIKMWWKPQVILIWLGSVFMVFGAMLSLLFKRNKISKR
ncbi:heme lyase CcmF/NrfE family subunit [Candidatus Endowatersipora endosymbiont of Watersipora subatra]|uniref:heme lyase CcmF/NrfE family subunit n=1 Tax=Candidatus Endowatersipora endosymbiont of Watersipora subatra TaxID=3077946 RepID=UPI00312CBEBC